MRHIHLCSSPLFFYLASDHCIFGYLEVVNWKDESYLPFFLISSVKISPVFSGLGCVSRRNYSTLLYSSALTPHLGPHRARFCSIRESDRTADQSFPCLLGNRVTNSVPSFGFLSFESFVFSFTHVLDMIFIILNTIIPTGAGSLRRLAVSLY